MQDPGTWNLQFKQTHASLARRWIDTQLIPHLANQFADDENGENDSLVLKDLGAPVRQYATKNSHTTKSDTSSVQGSSMDAYVKPASTFVPTSVSGPCQPAPKKGFRPKTFPRSRSYAEIVHEQQQNLQSSNIWYESWLQLEDSQRKNEMGFFGFGKQEVVTKLVFGNTRRANLIKYLNQNNCDCLEYYLLQQNIFQTKFPAVIPMVIQYQR